MAARPARVAAGTGTTPRRRPRRSTPTAGSTPATRAARRGGVLHHRRPPARTCSSPAASTSTPPRSRASCCSTRTSATRRWSACPTTRWGEVGVAFVVPRARRRRRRRRPRRVPRRAAREVQDPARVRLRRRAAAHGLRQGRQGRAGGALGTEAHEWNELTAHGSQPTAPPPALDSRRPVVGRFQAVGRRLSASRVWVQRMPDLLAHRVDGTGEPLLLLNGGMMSDRGLGGHRGAAGGALPRRALRLPRASSSRPARRMPGSTVTSPMSSRSSTRCASIGPTSSGRRSAPRSASCSRPSSRTASRSLVAATAVDHASPAMTALAQAVRDACRAAVAGDDGGRMFDAMLPGTYSDAFRAANAAHARRTRRARVAALPPLVVRRRRSACSPRCSISTCGPFCPASPVPTLVVVAGRDRRPRRPPAAVRWPRPSPAPGSSRWPTRATPWSSSSPAASPTSASSSWRRCRPHRPRRHPRTRDRSRYGPETCTTAREREPRHEEAHLHRRLPPVEVRQARWA